MQQSLAALCAGFILDFILGDPEKLWHPVQGIGALISAAERVLRSLFPKTPQGERMAGGVLVLFVLSASVAIPFAVLQAAGMVHPALKFVISCVFCWQLLAAKSLKKAAMKVYTALETEGLEAGRKAVSMIVGRDTAALTEEGVVKAAVETVAENTSDGITAPLFYMVLAGPLGGFAYKAVNTMDSMIGYKNDRYRFFGTCAARLDDVLNYIPARLSALFLLLASALPGFRFRSAWRVYRRDRKNHKSPNAAQTEAVMAGALGVQLAGDAYYFGKLYRKPYIGDREREIERKDIVRACRMEYAAVIAQFLVFVVLKAAVLMKLG